MIEDSQYVTHFHQGNEILDVQGRFLNYYEPAAETVGTEPYGAGMSLDYDSGAEISQDKFREYFDPATNTIKDPQGLVTWLKSVNPQLLEKDDQGEYIWTNQEIIDWVVKRGPSMFADSREIALQTQKLKLGAGSQGKKQGRQPLKI